MDTYIPEYIVDQLHETRVDKKTSPSHYRKGGVEVIEITEQLCFCSGNVVKYVARAGSKPGESKLDDLRKAKWYLDRLVENEEKKNG
jgi:hypothetical protein